ncbi:MAG: thioredoxin family protein [Anaerolineales bacterium]|nr:thioredoxin family protein [Anaerolineales bacterium]
MKIEILGTGCYNCVRLETLIDEIAGELGAARFEVTRVSNEKRILEYIPLEEIPGLLIDGVLASAGEIPARETLVEWLSGVSIPGTAMT